MELMKPGLVYIRVAWGFASYERSSAKIQFFYHFDYINHILTNKSCIVVLNFAWYKRFGADYMKSKKE